MELAGFQPLCRASRIVPTAVITCVLQPRRTRNGARNVVDDEAGPSLTRAIYHAVYVLHIWDKISSTGELEGWYAESCSRCGQKASKEGFETCKVCKAILDAPPIASEQARWTPANCSRCTRPVTDSTRRSCRVCKVVYACSHYHKRDVRNSDRKMCRPCCDGLK
jgi:hypothetical protein